MPLHQGLVKGMRGLRRVVRRAHAVRRMGWFIRPAALHCCASPDGRAIAL